MLLKQSELQTRLHNELLQTQLEIQQEKLKEASSAIYNNIGQVLACVRLGVLKAARLYKDVELEEQSKLLAQAINDLRDLNTRLDPATIISKGIATALQEEMDLLRHNYLVRTRVEEFGAPYTIPTEATFITFRILQECMQIAAQHMRPKNLMLSIIYTDEHTIFSLKDDGLGFDRHPQLLQGSTLVTLEQRARLANATLEIDSNSDYGTNVTIKLLKHNDYTSYS